MGYNQIDRDNQKKMKYKTWRQIDRENQKFRYRIGQIVREIKKMKIRWKRQIYRDIDIYLD